MMCLRCGTRRYILLGAIATFQRCNREIARVVNTVASCRRYQLVTYIHIDILRSRRNNFYTIHEKAQEGAESSSYSATKDCFLNGGSFLSRENRGRVGYISNERRRRECKERTKERERMR